MLKGKININQMIDTAKFSKFHLIVFILSYVIVLFDGYDVTINGVVLPLLMQEWGLNTSQAGLLASMAIFGMMVGAMLMGMLADRIGRKYSIIVCVILFSGFTFWCGFSKSPKEFAILRFIAGIGIGGVIPIITALVSEYSPLKMRSTLVTTMLSGTAVGAIMAALLGKLLVHDYGWQIMFYIAGIPLLFLPIILIYLPESLTFIVKNKRLDDAHKLIKKFQPTLNLDHDSELELIEETKEKASITEIFKDGRARITLLFSLSMFMALLMLYALGSWLPKLMINAGYSMDVGLTFLMVLSIGAVIGNICGGILADKFSLNTVIGIYFLMGAISLFCLSFQLPSIILYILIGIAGASASACCMMLYSYVAQYYHLSIRSTGIGWVSAVGRVGAIFGPIILGLFLGMGLPHKLNFIIVAIPALIGAMLIFAIRKDEEISNVKLSKV